MERGKKEKKKTAVREEGNKNLVPLGLQLCVLSETYGGRLGQEPRRFSRCSQMKPSTDLNLLNTCGNSEHLLNVYCMLG